MPRQLKALPPLKRERARKLLADGMAPTVIAAELKLAWADWERLAESDRFFRAVLDEAAARDRESLLSTLRTSKTAQAAIFILRTVHGMTDSPAGPAKGKRKDQGGSSVGVVMPKARTAAEFGAAHADEASK